MRRLREGLLARAKDDPKAEMPFLDHLEELRWRILWSLLALVLGFAVGFFLVIYFDAMAILLAPGRGVLGEDWLPQALAPNENFFFALKVAIVISIVLASPTLVYQAWRFLSPALEKHEKRAIVPSLYLGLVLFIAGVAMAYFIVLPFYLDFMVNFGSGYMTQDWTANHDFSEVMKLLLVMGFVFELPVVILILSVRDRHPPLPQNQATARDRGEYDPGRPDFTRRRDHDHDIHGGSDIPALRVQHLPLGAGLAEARCP